MVIMSDELTNKKKILIIEDNIETQLIFKIYLRDKYVLEIADTAEKGLELLNKNLFDILLLDINLPGDLSGEDVIEKVKKDYKLEKIPVIVVTAYALKGDREKYLGLGADEYISKPVNKSTLLGIVDKYMYV
jgi:two-component system, sensor histidine kinase